VNVINNVPKARTVNILPKIQRVLRKYTVFYFLEQVVGDVYVFLNPVYEIISIINTKVLLLFILDSEWQL
jgi:hypothetical protein